MSMSSGKAQTLSVTITQLSGASGSTASHLFPSNTAVVTGGSGNYAYSWAEFDDGIGAWSFGSQGSATTSVTCAGMSPSTLSQAQVTCQVLDNTTGKLATSNQVTYTYSRN